MNHKKTNKKDYTTKAKIVEVRFSPETDIVSWQCVLPDESFYFLHWFRPQFGPAMGIKADIPASIIEDTLGNFVGKEISLIIKDKDYNKYNRIEESENAFLQESKS